MPSFFVDFVTKRRTGKRREMLEVTVTIPQTLQSESEQVLVRHFVCNSVFGNRNKKIFCRKKLKGPFAFFWAILRFPFPVTC